MNYFSPLLFSPLSVCPLSQLRKQGQVRGTSAAADEWEQHFTMAATAIRTPTPPRNNHIASYALPPNQDVEGWDLSLSIIRTVSPTIDPITEFVDRITSAFRMTENGSFTQPALELPLPLRFPRHFIPESDCRLTNNTIGEEKAQISQKLARLSSLNQSELSVKIHPDFS